MKVLILSASPRQKGNSDLLCDAFARGAQEAGHTVRKMRTANMRISGCFGCNFCKSNNGECAVTDDMQLIYPAIREADVIVFGTPVYYYTVSAQLKLVWDRTYADFNLYKGKRIFLISSCAAPTADYTTTLKDCFEKYCSCFPDAITEKTIIGYGVTEMGAVQDTPAMQEAYETGRNL